MRKLGLMLFLLVALRTTGVSASWKPILLSFPALSQKDPNNYRDRTLMSTEDSPGVQECPVMDLACAATVYTIVERGLGNERSFIDDFYPDPRKHDGKTNGAVRPDYVQGDSEIDVDRIVSGLDAKRPTILHGYGGRLKEHFVLAVGINKTTDGSCLLAIDPWPGSNRSFPGRQVEMTIQSNKLVSPFLPDVAFTHMRLLDEKLVNVSHVSKADLLSVVWGLAGIGMATPDSSTGQPGESTAPAAAPNANPWTATPMASLASVIQDPAKFNDRTFRFYGTLGMVSVGGQRKTFVFQELATVDSKQEWVENWNRLTQSGPEITVLWDAWYKRKAAAPEGRSMIRAMTDHATVPPSPMEPKYEMIARVRESLDTFQAYLELVDLRPAAQPPSQPAAASHELVQKALPPPKTYLDSEDPNFRQFLAGYPDAKHFKERLVDFSRDYDTVWDAIVSALAEGEDRLAISNKAKGTLATEISGPGVLLAQNRRLVMRLEKESRGAATLRFRVLGYCPNMQGGKRTYTVDPFESVNDRMAEKFSRAVSEQLSTRP